MDTILRDGLKTAKSEQSGCSRRLHQARRFLHAGMVGHTDDLDSSLFASRNDRSVVFRFGAEAGFLAVPFQIGVSTHLQRVAVEPRAAGKRQGRIPTP